MGNLGELTPQQRAAMIAMVTASALLFSSLTSVVVALPTIQRDLDLDSSELHWVVVAALLPVSAIAVVSGRLGDVVGRRRVFLIGMMCFGSGSVLCALAPGGEFLVGARAVQGLGIALAVPLAVANLAAALPSHTHGWAMGVQTAVTSFFGIAVPLGVALLVQFGDWRWAFVAPVPATVLVVFLTFRYMTETRTPGRTSVDVLGGVLIAPGLTLLVFACERSSAWGYLHPGTVLSFSAGVLLIVAFILVELRTDNPLLDLRPLRHVTVWGPMAALGLVQCAALALVIYVTLYLQHVQNFGAFLAGLLIMVSSLGTIALSSFTGHLTDRGYGRLLTVVGLGILGCCLLWLAVGVAGRHGFLLLPALVVFGFAPPLVYPAATTLIMGALPSSAQGVGASLAIEARQLGATLGLGLTHMLFTWAEWRQRNVLLRGSAAGFTPDEQSVFDDILAQGKGRREMLARLPTALSQQRVRLAADSAFTAALVTTLLVMGGIILLTVLLAAGAYVARRFFLWGGAGRRTGHTE
ncbi:MFS transporter [Streptomyces sp. 1222.5]|uniref:MFS transporter n=1 Tax=Streptomyces sp. 1222.5 TaxID=1881026 RepID=UPI003EBA1C3C